MDGATFWSAVGAIGTCVAAVVAVLAYRAARAPGPDGEPPPAPREAAIAARDEPPALDPRPNENTSRGPGAILGKSSSLRPVPGVPERAQEREHASFRNHAPGEGGRTPQLEALHRWLREEKALPLFWPKGWSNVEARIVVDELGLGFLCDDKSIGWFRVVVVDVGLREVGCFEGGNTGNVRPVVGLNARRFPDQVIFHMFHMARCRREFRRTDDIKWVQGFEFHRDMLLREAKKQRR